MTYKNCFVSYRRDVSDKAGQYLQGLLKRGIRKNAEDIEEVVPNATAQNLQQFISDSKWDYKPVLRQTALNANELIGDETDAGFVIDESGFHKKGDKSVGVARQWLGCLGKTDNGQVGVYASLCNATRSTLINTRLYLPEVWTSDKQRCLDAGIPEEQIVFRTKEELAIEMLDEAIELGLQFGWVGTDAGYGKGLHFPLEVEKRQKVFMVDVHKDQRIFLTKPKPYIPVKKNPRGRTPTEFVVDESHLCVDKYADSLSEAQWTKIQVRDSTKGPILYEVHEKRVYLWQPDMKNQIRQWWLVIRRNAEAHDDYKYSLSSALSDTSLKRLAEMQGERYWIEHAIEVCKGDCGMADYEIRGWHGWHRHMSLAMMAQYFLLRERITKEKEYPMLSPRDVMELLAFFLPQKEVTVDSIIEKMEKRHMQRARCKRSATKIFRKKWQSKLT